jgi:hypothetical protein
MRDPIWPTWVVWLALASIAVAGPWNRDLATRAAEHPPYRVPGVAEFVPQLEREDRAAADASDHGRGADVLLPEALQD